MVKRERVEFMGALLRDERNKKLTVFSFFFFFFPLLLRSVFLQTFFFFLKLLLVNEKIPGLVGFSEPG